MRLTTTYKIPFEGLATFITCQSFQKKLVLELFNLNLETEDKLTARSLSAESQKGSNALQQCFVENQKGPNAIDFIR